MSTFYMMSIIVTQLARTLNWPCKTSFLFPVNGSGCDMFSLGQLGHGPLWRLNSTGSQGYEWYAGGGPCGLPLPASPSPPFCHNLRTDIMPAMAYNVLGNKFGHRHSDTVGECLSMGNTPVYNKGVAGAGYPLPNGEHGIRLIFSGGSSYSCKGQRRIMFDLVCDPTASPSSVPISVSQGPVCTYTFRWRSPFACPKHTTAPCPAPAPPAPAAPPYLPTLLPAAPPDGQAFRNGSLSSWGGNAVLDPLTEQYHLFAAGMTQGCNLVSGHDSGVQLGMCLIDISHLNSVCFFFINKNFEFMIKLFEYYSTYPLHSTIDLACCVDAGS